MKRSWRKFFQRVASLCIAGGTSLWFSACCYATVASDNASDPVYNDGWQAGDNGGTGFTPWDFSSSLTFNGIYYGQYADSTFHMIDDGLRAGTHYSNPFNNIGRAWAIGVSESNAAAGKNGGPPRAGRGFTLSIGETLKVTFDNPTDQKFFKGYQINLNGGTGKTHGNICYGGVPCNVGETSYRKVSLATFEYGTNGEWGLNDGDSMPPTGVFDTDTAEAGAVFSVTRTAADTYNASINSLGPGADFSATGRPFLNPGEEIDWIDITFFNTETDTGTPPTLATDLYIRSMEIVGPSPTADFDGNGAVDGNDLLRWQRNLGLLTGATKAQGNSNPESDGDVDAGDLNAWKTQFGSNAVAAISGVPEPSGWFIALAAAVAVFPSLRR